MAFAYVQSAQNSGSSTTPNATLGAGATAGNLLVIGVQTALTTAPSVGSSGFTAGTTASGGSGTTQRASRLMYKVSTGGETLVTVAAGNAAWSCSLVEYSGVDNASPFNCDNAQIVAAGTVMATNTATKTGSPSEVLVVCWSGQRSTPTAWSSIQIPSGTAANSREQRFTTSAAHVLYDRTIASPGASFTGTATSDASAVGDANIIVFNPAAAPAAPIPDVVMAPARIP